MQQRSQRYVRRQRGWIGQAAGSQASAGEGRVGATETDGKSVLRGRRRRSQFGERLNTTSAIVGLTPEDEAWIAKSQANIAPHIPQVVEDVYHALLSRPETAAYFTSVQGTIDRAQVAMRRESFEEWLHAVVEDPLDEETAAFLASVGRAHVRAGGTGDRIKARYLLATISRVQSSFLAILANSIADPAALGACSAAWCKRLFVHLDLLLAVYGSTESTAHWY
jgi:hypothetical protein